MSTESEAMAMAPSGNPQKQACIAELILTKMSTHLRVLQCQTTTFLFC
jgi:hypothetical protein